MCSMSCVDSCFSRSALETRESDSQTPATCCVAAWVLWGLRCWFWGFEGYAALRRTLLLAPERDRVLGWGLGGGFHNKWLHHSPDLKEVQCCGCEFWWLRRLRKKISCIPSSKTVCGRRGCNMFHIVLFVFFCVFLCFFVRAWRHRSLNSWWGGLGSVAASDNMCSFRWSCCFFSFRCLVCVHFGEVACHLSGYHGPGSDRLWCRTRCRTVSRAKGRLGLGQWHCDILWVYIYILNLFIYATQLSVVSSFYFYTSYILFIHRGCSWKLGCQTSFEEAVCF